jgi:signal transduction histidine kinase
VWMSTGRALRPVEAMRLEASTITSEHLHRRLPSEGGTDEFTRLARTLNEMLDRIDAASKLQRQFVSDASHELRSPLAAIRQLTEVARRYPGRADAARLAQDVQAEEQRMEQMVTALLTLARLENQTQSSARSAVDVDEVVLQQVVRVRELGAGPRIEVGRVDAARVRCNESLVAQVVHNLLTNARRHAREWVHVSLSTSGGACQLVVDDDGNGVGPESREVVFERFVRLDEARARDEGGSGLGLAIVRKVVTDLGGRVVVEDSPAGGARFVVSLPLAPDEDATIASEARSPSRA